MNTQIVEAITIYIFVTTISQSVMFPYSFNEIILAYTLVVRFGNVYGILAMLIIDPLAIGIASLLPFFFTRLMCSDCISSNFIEKMRIFKALAPLFETQGLKLTTLIRLSGFISNAGGNYILAATKVGLKPYILGTMIGILPESVICGFVAT